MLMFPNSIQRLALKPIFYNENSFSVRRFRSTFLPKIKLFKNTRKNKSISFNKKEKLKFELLNVFYTLTICGNITLASECLCISQPAISLSINKLEKETGTLLFDKSNKKKYLKLTSSGLILFNYVQRLFQVTQETIDLSNSLLRLSNDNQIINRQILNTSRIYTKQKFSTFDIFAHSLKIFTKLKFEHHKIFNTKPRFLLLNINSNFITNLPKEKILLTPTIKSEIVELDKIRPVDLINTELISNLNTNTLIEIQTIKALSTCLELEISNLVFWGTEV